MDYDNKAHYEACIEEMEYTAWHIAEQSGAEDYDEFISYVLKETQAEELLGDEKEVRVYFRDIWSEYCANTRN